MPAEQLNLAFASLDFPGRSALYPHEIAEKLGMSIDQLYKLVDQGLLVGIDIASRGATKRRIRIPVESYRTWVAEAMSGPARDHLLRNLPAVARRDLCVELLRGLSLPEQRGVLKLLRAHLPQD